MGILTTLARAVIFLGYKRPLAPNPARSKYRNRHSARRINALMPSSGVGTRYLEVGVERGLTFEAVQAELKVCVDPFPLFRKNSLPKGTRLVVSTSDEFFATEVGSLQYDFIFLDGLHTAEAAYRDLVGAFKMLAPGGTILIDDVMPSDEASSLPAYRDSKFAKRRQGITHSRWYGDVWRVAWLLVTNYPSIEVTLVGSGGNDHTQAVIKCRDSVGEFGLDSRRDEDFMKKLKFHEVVNPNGLGALVSPEKLALSRFGS